LYDRFDRCQAPLESETVFMIRPPMDLAYMAAALETAGVECRIRDYPAEKKGWDSLEGDLHSYNISQKSYSEQGNLSSYRKT
jgi:hypothetical protein